MDLKDISYFVIIFMIEIFGIDWRDGIKYDEVLLGIIR